MLTALAQVLGENELERIELRENLRTETVSVLEKANLSVYPEDIFGNYLSYQLRPSSWRTEGGACPHQ